jgi:hypothetical protein
VKLAYIVAMVVLCGCSSGDHPREGTDDSSYVTDTITLACVGVTTPEPCDRPDGLPGHCANNMCVISCASSAACPLSACRIATCISGMCQYLGAPNGTSCNIAGNLGLCESYQCIAGDP